MLLIGSLLLTSVTLSAQDVNLLGQLREAARPLVDTTSVWRAFGDATRSATVVGLGEATHGQHETFDLKRRLTMELVRHHGVRVVAYESSASRARVIDTWIQGSAAELVEVMGGFGMLIWMVEENAALLRDLRDWNTRAAPADRVRFIGVDAQDGGAVVSRLRQLLGQEGLGVIARVEDLVARAPAAVERLFQGQRASYDSLESEAGRIANDLTGIAAGHGEGAEVRLRMRELQAHLTMYATSGGRDQAMAELLLLQLGDGERAVFWGHNAHVKRSALDYLGSIDLAMGGHLARALGDKYYAVGFAFGSGGFQANALDSAGRWGFRRFQHSPPASGSLEATLVATTLGDFFLDLRGVAEPTTLHRWMHQPHGHRWWGGYNIPDDADARTRDAAALLPMTPALDFDALIFQERTTAATPMNRSRIMQ